MKCKRKEFNVDAVQYEIGSGLEDGFQLVSKVFLEEIEQTLQNLKINTVYMFKCDLETDFDLFVKNYLETRNIKVIVEKE